MTRWEAIEESFTRLHNFALTDIEGFASNRTGGNYGLVDLVGRIGDAQERLARPKVGIHWHRLAAVPPWLVPPGEDPDQAELEAGGGASPATRSK